MKETKIFKSEAGREAIIAAYNKIMDQWPIPYEDITISTRHGETHIIACGKRESPPLILLHGSGSNATMWIGDIVAYAEQYRVYAIDLPGEPGKSEPIRRELKGLAYAEWMEDIYHDLNLPKASLLGISMGGWMALRYATVYPERVEKLVLLCPGGVAPQKISLLFRVIPMMLMGSRGIDWMIKGLNKDVDMPEEALAYIRLISTNFHPRMVLPLFTDVELRRLTMPVLTIAGARDALLPSTKTIARLEKLLRNLTAILLPDAGHVLLGQADTVMDFLGS